MQNETLKYDVNGTTMHSELYLPENAQNAAAVLVFPEWWGLSEHAKQSAQKLAQAGYVALTVDVYGEGLLTDNAEIAGEKMQQTMSGNTLRERVQAAVNALTARAEVDDKRVAAIGYCFGGGVVLNMSRWGLPIRAAVSFHGNPDPLGERVKHAPDAAMLVEHGGLDSMVTMDKIDAFRNEMNATGARYHVDVFADAKHGFTNPQATENGKKNGVDLAYNETAARESWENMLAWLAKAFG
ncbi:dienelactone hydrolase family protein [Neisseriaceae bacterium B1]